VSSVHDPRVGGERRSMFCCLCRKEAPDQGNIKYCLHPAHQRLLYRTFDGHGLAAISRSSVSHEGGKYSAQVCLVFSYLPFTPTPFRSTTVPSKYRARDNHVSGFRNDTAVHKINSPKSGFRRALNSISVITLLLLTRACPSDFLLSSSQSQPFCNTSLIFLFICQDASPLLDRSTLSGPNSPHILPYILFTGAAASRNDCYSTPFSRPLYG
jgi:hypothetical protein